MGRSRKIGGIAAASLTLAAAGCNKVDHLEPDLPSPVPGAPHAIISSRGRAKILLVTNGFSPFWDSMNQGRKDSSAKYKLHSEWMGPPNAQVAQQKVLMEQSPNEGFDSMAVSAIEKNAIAPEIDSLIGRGMNVITFDSDAPNSKRAVYIGTDNFQSGKEAGKEMVRLLPHGGNVWGFVGNISAENARERRDGFLDAVRSHKIKLVDVLEDEKEPNIARLNVEKVLASKGSQVQGLLGFYSYDLPAIYDAVRQSTMKGKIKIVGFDAEPVTLQALQSHGVDATVVQKPYEFGRLAVEFLYLSRRDGIAQTKREWDGLNPDYPLRHGFINTGVRVVTPTTVKGLLDQLKKWGVSSS